MGLQVKSKTESRKQKTAGVLRLRGKKSGQRMDKEATREEPRKIGG